MAECDGKRSDGVGVIDKAVEFRPFGPRFFHRVAHDHETGRQYLHVLARAAKLFHVALHVGIKLLSGGKIALRCEYRFRGFRRKLPTGLDAPACTITGQPWTGRAMLSGPRTERYSPL